jgi:glycerol-3-phosphate dehydrogenase
VRYAVRHEYALTATDVIARRIRLSFLNAQAAAEALPRVVDIMAEELNWSTARKQEELARTTRFLQQSMGLPPSAPLYRGWWEWARSKIDGMAGVKKASTSHGRAQFEPGEVGSLREAFLERSRDPAGRLGEAAVRELLMGLPAYAGVRTKDFDYVLEETGLAGQDIDADEFVEVRPPPPPPPPLRPVVRGCC